MGELTKEEVKRTLERLLSDEKLMLELLKDLGFDLDELRKELKLRLLYKHGLLSYVTIQEFSQITGIGTTTVRNHLIEWGFRKVGGIRRTHTQNLTAVMSGRTLRKGRWIKNLNP